MITIKIFFLAYFLFYQTESTHSSFSKNETGQELTTSKIFDFALVEDEDFRDCFQNLTIDGWGGKTAGTWGDRVYTFRVTNRCPFKVKVKFKMFYYKPIRLDRTYEVVVDANSYETFAREVRVDDNQFESKLIAYERYTGW